jgi:hypothetical protein
MHKLQGGKLEGGNAQIERGRKRGMHKVREGKEEGKYEQSKRGEKRGEWVPRGLVQPALCAA